MPFPSPGGGTNVVAGAGIAVNSGTISLASIPAGDVLANFGTASAAPAGAALAPGANVTITNGQTIAAVGGGGSGVTRLTSQLTPVGNGNDTTEDTLQTFTMGAGQLASVGQAVRIRASGTFAANTHNKALKLRFGSAAVAGVSGIVLATEVGWSIDATVYKTGANTQYAEGKILTESASNAVILLFTFATPVETDTAPIVIKTTGQVTGTTAANDIVCNSLLVEFLS